MILIDWEQRGRPSGVALLFGAGLVGDAIAAAMMRAVGSPGVVRLGWTWSGPLATEATVIEDAATAALARRPGSVLTVIWAAGRNGFGADEAEMASEYAALERVVDLAARAGEALPSGQRRFVLVSSAGGLFEGQRACGADAAPAPLRPYGHGKLAQEGLVRSDERLGHRLIIRPSSVYGFRAGGRRGLIPALLAAGIQRRGARISGSMTTQRDYVYAPDIGRYAAARLLEPRAWSEPRQIETVLLAAGRPASILEVVQIVEDRLGTALFLSIDPRPENSCDNTFLPNASPPDFRPTALREGVALTAMALAAERNSGLAL